MVMADSFFKDGMDARQRHSSLSSRGRGEAQQSSLVDANVVSRRCRHQDFFSAPQASRATCSSGLCAGVDAPCCVSQSSRAAGANVNEQIAAALMRLQRDMANVVHRLHALEARTSSQVGRSHVIAALSM